MKYWIPFMTMFFFFQAEDGIRAGHVTGVKTCALPICGAQYPWESAATGEEVTPTWVPNPNDRTKLIRIWTGDIEIHISADIAFGIWKYWQATFDEAFLLERGAEVILETSRFWSCRAEWY